MINTLCWHITTRDNYTIDQCTISYRAVVRIIGYPAKCLIKLGNVSDVWWQRFARHLHVRALVSLILLELTWLGSAAPIIKYLPLPRINVCLNERFILSRAVFAYPHELYSTHVRYYFATRDSVQTLKVHRAIAYKHVTYMNAVR